MSWLWIYITLMEWVGIVLVVKALGDDTKPVSYTHLDVYKRQSYNVSYQ